MARQTGRRICSSTTQRRAAHAWPPTRCRASAPKSARQRRRNTPPASSSARATAPSALRQCLASLPQQTLAPREIIVVDNASRDTQTRDAALAAGAIYLREERPGLDFARNTGARHATSPIVAYTDDDVILHRAWLERLVAAFDAPQIAAVTGLVLPAELATESQRHFEAHWSFGRGYLRQDFDSARFAAAPDGVFPAWEIGAGASMAFRREVFERIGYFDERLDAGQAGCSGRLRVLVPRAGQRPHLPLRTALGGVSLSPPHDRMAWRSRSTSTCAATPRRCWCSTSAPASPRTAAAPSCRCRAGTPAGLLRRLRGARLPQDRFLREEVLGYLSGLWFYLRHRRENREGR